ncbi:MAG: flagellar basal body P-ring protein FlgI [Hyphomonadaceae bacterium]|nr:flagellar basal body P-ring protein FlgI [Hyphomonadaceae bacterium]
MGWIGAALAAACVLLTASAAYAAPLKALGRLEGSRENALVGYGVVVGLSGTGDSARSLVTRQSLSNVYSRFGVTVSPEDINSRNAAVVMVVASLPASAHVGDRISVTVSSTGDARSLAGGTLLMTPLMGPDRRAYAVAQGPLLAGGYSIDQDQNTSRRNYPTTARIEDGATVETAVSANVLGADGALRFLLKDPSFTTAVRIAESINTRFGEPIAVADGADSVRIRFAAGRDQLASFVAGIETLNVEPDQVPRVVVNERTGTVVAGGDVRISSVVIAQGDIRVTISSETSVSQPALVSGVLPRVASVPVTNTEITVEEGDKDVVATFPSSTVADLARGLSDAHVSTRRIIAILQAMRAAGALHAEIIVQ